MYRLNYCPNCGTKLLEGARFCQACGHRLPIGGPGAAPVAGEQRTATPPGPAKPTPTQEPKVSVTKGAGPPPEKATLDQEPPSSAAKRAAETRRAVAVICVDESHKERTAQEYYQAFKARLRERGKVVTHTQKPLTAAHLKGVDLLLVGGPEHPWVFGRDADLWDANEIEAIADFVAGGGALFVLGDGLGSVDRMNAIIAQYGITFRSDSVGDVTTRAAGGVPHPMTAGIDEICLGSVFGMGGFYLQVEEPATTLAKHDGRSVLACREHGRGRLVVISSLSAFSSQHIDRKGNSALLRRIMDYLLADRPMPEEAPEGKQASPKQAKAKKPLQASKKTPIEAKPPAKKKASTKREPKVPVEQPLGMPEAPKEEAKVQPLSTPPSAPTVQAQAGPIKLAHPLAVQEASVYVFGDEPTRYRLDFADHVQQFGHGLPPVPWEARAAEYARSLGKSSKDDYAFNLPFTVAEPWSPVNYLRRVLYHLTQGRISYFVDAETKRKRGGVYGMAWSAAKMNQARFEVRHPITFSDESFIGEWPVALESAWTGASGGLYLMTHRLLFAADQAWIKEDEGKTAPLPFLSFWSQVDFSKLLQALGMKGIPVLVERRQRPLPDRLATRMWFEPANTWRGEGNQRIIAITDWDLDLVFLEGRRGGDGQTAPPADQSWAFLGYRVTRTDRRQEFVAMIPHLIVPKGKGLEGIMRRVLESLRPHTVALDVLDLITLAKVARDNGLLHSADPVSWPVPLCDVPQQL
jgi:hypothetical protein